MPTWSSIARCRQQPSRRSQGLRLLPRTNRLAASFRRHKQKQQRLPKLVAPVPALKTQHPSFASSWSAVPQSCPRVYYSKFTKGRSSAKPLCSIAHAWHHPVSSSAGLSSARSFGVGPHEQRNIYQRACPRTACSWRPRHLVNFVTLPPHTGTSSSLSRARYLDFSSSSSVRRLYTRAMSSLSQPQTPAALGSPLREHRHRPVERVTDNLETPLIDNRSYRVVKLPNQLEVLLVHDADTDKASAAMDVNVGNFSDPAEFPGMAHAVSARH